MPLGSIIATGERVLIRWFRLFTQGIVWPVQVIQQLLGEQPLPWEGERLTGAQRTRLGVFRRPVLQLLERDPARRPTLQQFCDMCTSIFSATTTVNI